jgi:hypothetical protein
METTFALAKRCDLVCGVDSRSKIGAAEEEERAEGNLNRGEEEDVGGECKQKGDWDGRDDVGNLNEYESNKNPNDKDYEDWSKMDHPLATELLCLAKLVVSRNCSCENFFYYRIFHATESQHASRFVPTCFQESCEQAAFRLLFAGSYTTAGMDQLERDPAGQGPTGKVQLDRDQLFERDRFSTDKVFLCP